ncbi:hypothetical protein IQE94_17730 (plasmid) [Synechocystis sp. PCC 7339]|uniref:hypothetical protein n=1 Tax=Synechocystis sp. PCC 7339 TaxID=2782213 RepID=UPI001CC14C68|nr:hypothetical protein [Synechocystis sp. PCC 7339]UAJ74633.1 hypothetical protein IQE94_17730 [Synechocystis sp. PCC 7339]
MNSIFTISPYWTGSTWAFDAEEVGLLGEPFVSGADAILSAIVKRELALETEKGSQFELIFSAEGFPSYHACFERQETDIDYQDLDHGDRGWLCPATLKFFPNGHPEKLYIQVRAINK